MNRKNRMIALIPAYKPDRKLISLAEELDSLGFSVVIVNDGSGEEHDEIFRAVSGTAAVIAHEQNRGKGAALKTGLEYISAHFLRPYTVVTADADGQHRPQDILRTAEEAAQHRRSFVLGSRRFDKDVPLRSRFGNTVTRGVFRLCSGVSIYDTQTGLRAFTDRLVQLLLSVEGERYEFEMNVLMELAKRHIRLREVWIETVYLDGNSSSHFDTLRDSARIYRGILSYTFGRNRSRKRRSAAASYT